MEKTFLETNYFEFLNFKSLRSETQCDMNNFCSYYLENYRGSNRDNLESLRLFFSKFLRDNHKDSIFLSICNNSLKINIYDFNINFLKINDSLKALKDFINNFKEFLNS